MTTYHKRTLLTCALSCTTGALITVSAANAQIQIEEVVVTAQKRAENIQDVPISVSAVTASAIKESGVRNVEDLAVTVPGVTLTRQSTATQIFIRGIGTTGTQSGNESAVATFIDGVYIPSMSGATFSLNNIERVEVLKGPQGTLFGRNATGGAVNIITKTPTREFALDAEIGYGNYDTTEGNFYITGGLSDTVAADLALYYSDQAEGTGKNIYNGQDVNDRRDVAARSKIHIEPNDATRITLGADYAKNEGSAGMSYRFIPTAPQFLTGVVGFPYGFWDINGDLEPALETENWGLSGRVEYDFNDMTFTSLSAYRELDSFQGLDLDMTILPFIAADITETGKQFTQEFQLASNTASGMQWIVGVFYLSGEAAYDPYTLAGMAFDPLASFTNLVDQDTTSYAAFGQTTFPLGENTNLTLGARYTVDKREFKVDGTAVLAVDGVTVVPTFQRDEDESYSEPTWRIAIDHRLNEDMMVYASYSRGFKSGGYNSSLTPGNFEPPVEPELLDAFEVGMKSDLFGGRARLNAALFYYQYDDIQVSIIRGAEQNLLNAAEAESYGLDVEFEALLTEKFSVRGGGQIMRAEYDKFENAPFSEPLLEFPYGILFTARDVSGNRMVRAPDFQFNLSADYRTPLAGGELALNLTYSYSDEYYFDPDNRLTQDAFGVVNSQIRWTSPSQKYFVRLYGRNLTEEKYYIQSQSIFTGDLASAAPPRTYGISFGISLQ
ncbi:MAG: TonB-dependent receptor [Porticoccaceae bacterium]